MNNNGTQYGLYLGDNFKAYNNTIVLDRGGTSAATLVACVRATPLIINAELKNNIFYMTHTASPTLGIGTGYACVWFSNAATTGWVFTMDNNDFYIGTPAANRHVVRFGTAIATPTNTLFETLAAWQTNTSTIINIAGKDPNSVSVDPLFTNAPGGNLKPQNPALNNLGTPISGITTDILGITRNITTPDIGAWEFSPVSCLPPTALSASAPNLVATLNWTLGGSETQWDIEYGVTGFVFGSGTRVTGTTTKPYLTPALTKLTTYQFYVRGRCSSTDTSAWVGPFAFTTGCAGPLNGAYTLNAGAPASATNYQDFTTLATDLMSCGIGGPVIVVVAAASGPYNEQFLLGSIPGSSSTNTVTIQGSGNTLEFLSTISAQRATIKFDGTDYVTINDLIIKALGVDATTGNYGYGVQLMNGADFNTFDGCTIEIDIAATSSTEFGGFVASSSATSLTSATTSNANNLLINNCTIVGGYYGIVINGATDPATAQNNTIQNSTVRDFYLDGIRMNNTENALVMGNDISRAVRTSVTTFNGIQLIGRNSNTQVRNNRIHNNSDNGTTTSTAYGIYSNSTTVDASTDVIIIANNAIYNLNSNSTTMYGITLQGTAPASDNIRVWHNTIVLDRQVGTSVSVVGIHSSVTSVNTEIKNNNIFLNHNSTNTTLNAGLAYTSTSLTAGNPVSDYNNVFVGPNSPNGKFGRRGGTTNVWHLSAWQSNTGLDAASDSIDPELVDPFSGNLMPASAPFNNLGTPIAGVTTDILGAPRSLTTPDIGAWEFTPPTCVKPNTLYAQNITTTSAQVGWTEVNSATSWQVSYGLSTLASPSQGTKVVVGTNPTTLNGLASFSNHKFWVRAICVSGSDTSYWAGPFTFKTKFDCPPNAICEYYSGQGKIQSDFRTAANLTDSSFSDCPAIIPIMLDYPNPIYGSFEILGVDVYYDFVANGGVPNAWMSEQRSRLVLPSNNKRESVFTTGVGNSAGTMTYSRLGISDFDGTLLSNVVPLNFELHAFRTFGNTSPNTGCNTYYNYIDSGSMVLVVYFTSPSCNSSVIVDHIESCYTILDVSNAGTVQGWNVEYGPAGFTQGQGTIDNNTQPPFFVNTQPKTSYDYYFKQLCGPFTVNWDGPYTFTSSPRDSGSFVATACDSYTWNSQTYTSSGQYQQTFVSQSSCDSVATLILTINNSILWYLDTDADGYYVNDSLTCTSPGTGWTNVLPSGGLGDCNDANANAWATAMWYLDNDLDGYYVNDSLACGSPGTGWTNVLPTGGLGDCNDANANAWATAMWYLDNDLDGHYVNDSLACGSPGTGWTNVLPSGGLGDCNDADNTVWQNGQFYVDADGDGYGASATTVTLCYGASTPAGHSPSSLGVDCNDANNLVWQNGQFYVDGDGDGYGASATTVTLCYGASTPAGHSLTSLGIDCNDADNTKWQSASLYIDADNDGYDAGQATVCYGSTPPTGYKLTTLGPDCDDNNPNVWVGQTWYLDADADGHYVTTQFACGSPGTGWNTTGGTSGDCDDNNNLVWQSALLYVDADGDGYDAGQATVCYGASVPTGYSLTTNGTDCDDTNNSITLPIAWYLDADNDGHYVSTQTACASPGAGWNSTGGTLGDCNDNNNLVWQIGLFYADADGDGYSPNATPTSVCYGNTTPTGYVVISLGLDCDDSNPNVWIGQTWYLDADADGHYVSTQFACGSPGAGWTTTAGIAGDCNDANNLVWQSALLYVDADGDGYDAGQTTVCYGASVPTGYSLTTNGTDCDDTNNSITLPVTWYLDADNDGHYVNTQTACSSPGAGWNTTGGTSGDCNDNINMVWQNGLFYVDADGDGYAGNNGTQVNVCYGNTTPTGYSLTSLGNDCDDSNPNVFLGQTWYLDADADGHYVSSQFACGSPGAGWNTTGGTSGDCNDNNNLVWQNGLFYVDADGDGYAGNNGTQVSVCYGNTTPTGYSLTSLGNDCDDSNPNVFLGQTWYLDADADGHYVSSQFACGSPGAGWTTTAGIAGDCNDGNNLVWQSALLYVDADGDGYDAGQTTVCYGASVPTGYSLTTNGTDCDDTNNSITLPVTWYLDADNDGHYVNTQTACTSPGAGWNTTGGASGDCNDNNNMVWQNGLFYVDADGDGYAGNNGTQVSVCYGNTTPTGYSLTSLGNDCNDNNNTVWIQTMWYKDGDNDGWYISQLSCSSPGTGWSNTPQTQLGDCNDANNTIYPGATEICGNGIDEDCNGSDLPCVGGNCNAVVTLTPEGLKPFWGPKAANPATFYHGVTQWKDISAKITGGVGPYTYSWSMAGNVAMVPRPAANRVAMFEAKSAVTVTVIVTDIGANCTYTQSINIGWDNQFFCGNPLGNAAAYWKILVCEAGTTKCEPWAAAKTKILSSSATLGTCTPKADDLAARGLFMEVFPNPNSGQFVVTVHNLDAKATLEVYDLNSKRLFVDEITPKDGQVFRSFDFGHLPAGMYFIQLNDGENVASEKVVIRH